MEKQVHVSYITDRICISDVDEKTLPALIGLGATVKDDDSDAYILSFKTREEEIVLMKIIRDLGIPFSEGRDWCPAEIFEEYREKGLLSGMYKSIAWKGSNNYTIREK